MGVAMLAPRAAADAAADATAAIAAFMRTGSLEATRPNADDVAALLDEVTATCERARAAGFRHHLVKPVELAQIEDVFASLERAAARQSV